MPKPRPAAQKLETPRAPAGHSAPTAGKSRARGGRPGNRRAWKAVAVAVLVSLLVAGAAAAVYFIILSKGDVMLSEEEFREQMRVGDEAEGMFREKAVEEGEDRAAAEVVQWLKEQDLVKDAAQGTGCIWVEFTDGTGHVILTTEPVETTEPAEE